MATQTVEFRAPTGLTLTAKLFTAGSDTVVQTASAVTEAANRKGTYAATFTDPGVAEFELIALSASTPVCRWFTTLTAATATFQAYEVRTASVVNVDNVIDGVWDESMSGHTVNGSYGSHLVRSQNQNQNTVQITGSNHIAADVHAFQADVIDSAALATSAVNEIAAAIGTTGTGARTVTITVNDGATVLQNARVRVVEGVNTYTSLTNASGIVVFNLDDATYTVSITKPGYSYAGTSLIVDGTETRTYSMTAIVIPTPSDPALCYVTMHIYDQYGADLDGQPIEITFVKWDAAATDTPPVLSPPPTLSTDVNGILTVELFREATYKIVYGNAPYTRRVDVTIPDASTYTVEL